MLGNAFFAVRIGLYLVKLLLYYAYLILRFCTKRAARILVPVALILILYAQRPALHGFITAIWRRSDPGIEPEGPVLDAILVVAYVIFVGAFLIVARIINSIMSAFPVPVRPFAPMRRLRPKTTTISPAVVKIVVPPLPKR